MQNHSSKSIFSEQQTIYCEALHKFNSTIITLNSSSNDSFNPKIVQHFSSEVSQNLNGIDEKNFAPVWKFVSNLAERCEDEPGQTRSWMIPTSIKFLTDQFETHMQSKIVANLQNVTYDPVPGSLELVLSYIDLIDHKSPNQFNLTASNAADNNYADEDGLFAGRYPIWKLLYYLFRAGHYELVLRVIDESK